MIDLKNSDNLLCAHDILITINIQIINSSLDVLVFHLQAIHKLSRDLYWLLDQYYGKLDNDTNVRINI